MEMLAEGGVEVEWIEARHVSGPIRRPSSEVICLPDGAKPWFLFSAFGVPDLADHLARLLDQGNWAVVLLLDPVDPLPEGTLDVIVGASRGRVQVVFLDRRSVSGTGASAASLDRLAREILATGADIGRIRMQLETLIARQGILGCVVSDHHAVQTVILRRLCAERRVLLRVLPHSAWPMEGSFALGGVDAPNEMYVAPTRRAAVQLAAVGRCRLAPRPLPSPRYRPRVLRFLRRACRWVSPKRNPVSVGVVVTSGEELSAPDVALADVADNLRALCSLANGCHETIRLHVRLRDREDRSEVLKILIGPDAEAAVWEKSSYRTPLEFLWAMDLIVEIGTPGSVMLESFAQVTPFVHLGAAGPRRGAFLPPVGLVPQVQTTLAAHVSLPYLPRWRRVALGIRQFLHLVLDTQPEMRICRLFSSSGGGSDRS
jgi:hypothetical protein